ncbi:hypothetical protein AU359_01126 [Micrococcus luteus]|uniref:DUF6270 domain-containing protein n=1 Tax=Micrococcus luteus TaxID=1270 RepID=UPI000763603B|nr:DUF6270 domain-containing protein [Micrococcus luteus]KWW40530.1 hypothetical protein AU359_01126 [Micrococcus luteus]MCT2254139.1 DUF6270 domain-containing protein [Micrococcus luteus]MCV7452619.1 DUF6270 domain-containing protein [Micrococcus luteus]MCV7515478.1 DUF6270 domain-containing protein [Micrococcus luteus]MCV7647335.1 DUF6270 domain-containing protein [Micrococcus luteus]
MTLRTTVLGSRLTFNALSRHPDFVTSTAGFLSRVSLAGCGTPPVAEVDLASVPTPARTMLTRDLDRTLLADVVVSQPDVVVLDALEERWPLVVLPSGAVVTASPELGRLGKVAGERVPFGSDRHFALWEAGWERALLVFESVGLRDRLVLHRVLLPTQDEAGDVLAGAAERHRANQFLARVYGRMQEDLPWRRVVALPPAAAHAAASGEGNADPLALSPDSAAELTRRVLTAVESTSGGVAGRPGGLFLHGDLSRAEEDRSLVVLLDGLHHEDGAAPRAVVAAQGWLTQRAVPWFSLTVRGGQTAVSEAAAELAELSEATGRDLLLVGGGGAGYEALRLAGRLGDAASALAWNPDAGPEPQDEEGDGASTERVDSLVAGRRALVLQGSEDPRLQSTLMPVVQRTPGAGPGPLLYGVGDGHAALVLRWPGGEDDIPPAVLLLVLDALRRGGRPRAVLSALQRRLASGPPAAVAHAPGAVPEARSSPEEMTGPEPAEAPVVDEPGPAEGASAGLAVRGADDGRVRVDWDLAELSDGRAAGADFSIEADGLTEATVEDAVPPLIVQPLGDDGSWRLDLRDGRGRAVGSVRFDRRARRLEPPTS